MVAHPWGPFQGLPRYGGGRRQTAEMALWQCLRLEDAHIHTSKPRPFLLSESQPPLLPAKMLTGRFDSIVSYASLTRATDGQESHLPEEHI